MKVKSKALRAGEIFLMVLTAPFYLLFHMGILPLAISVGIGLYFFYFQGVNKDTALLIGYGAMLVTLPFWLWLYHKAGYPLSKRDFTWD